MSKSSFGTGVDISSYTSTAYTCPSDGYVMVNTTSPSISSWAQLGINDTIYHRCGSNDLIPMFTSIPVKKGMELKTSGNNYQAVFYPLV